MKLFGKLKQQKATRNITSYANKGNLNNNASSLNSFLSKSLDSRTVAGESHLDFYLTSHCSPASPMVKNAPS